jgi:hypothetical protein
MRAQSGLPVKVVVVATVEVVGQTVLVDAGATDVVVTGQAVVVVPLPPLVVMGGAVVVVPAPCPEHPTPARPKHSSTSSALRTDSPPSYTRS